MDDGVTIKTLQDVKWTPELESVLEDALISAEFNFEQAAEIVSDRLNKDLGDNFTTYRVDSKSLQLKWTDIEIRQYTMHQLNQKIH